MLNSVLFDNKIRIWWEFIPNVDDGYKFVCFVNGEEKCQTAKTHFAFDTKPETEYNVLVKLVDKNGELIKQVGEGVFTSLKAKNKLDVTKAPYNAVGDGVTVNTKAIQKAIDDCTKDDCVYIPAGKFMSGALFLGSNVELLLDDNAILQGTSDINDYLPMIDSRFEGVERKCYASLINVGKMDHTKGCTTENVVVRGGTIYGGGQELRKNIIDTETAKNLAKANLKSGERPGDLLVCTGPGRYRGRLIEVYNTNNFILADSDVGYSPAWNLHFIYSNNVVTCGCKVTSHGISNGDGWDPDSSTNCVLFDTYFDTGDDCVAIKSGINPQGNEINRPTECVRVFDIASKGGHGIALGSEMSGGINDVKIWDCDIEHSFAGFHFKTTRERGGYLKNVYVYNAKACKIHIDNRMAKNNDGVANKVPPIIENINFEKITLTGIELYNEGRIDKANAVVAHGYEGEYKLKGLVLKDITLNYRVFDPYHQYFFNNVEDVTLENIICK